MSVEIEDKDFGFDDLMDAITDQSAGHVVVGIKSDEDQKIIKRAFLHEFGGTISVKGGTSYGYRTEKEARAGKVRDRKSVV